MPKQNGCKAGREVKEQKFHWLAFSQPSTVRRQAVSTLGRSFDEAFCTGISLATQASVNNTAKIQPIRCTAWPFKIRCLRR
jgi:hypothetical protein